MSVLEATVTRENQAIPSKTRVEQPKPILLTPINISRMLRKRHEFQVAKFRTTCVDCVPNY